MVETQAARIAALEARLAAAAPPKTPANSSLPPSRGQKAAKPRGLRSHGASGDGPSVTRALAADPDRTVGCHAQACAHCGTTVPAAGQGLRHAFDHLDLPPIRPVVTRVRIFGRRCPGCRRRVRGVAPAALPPSSPFGPSIVAMLAYRHHHHAVGYDRLAALMAELFGLRVGEGAIANALRRANRPPEQAGAAIVARLCRAAVIGCDETGARLTAAALGARMGWEWVLVSDSAILHRIRTSRGRDMIARRPGRASAALAGVRPLGRAARHAEAHQVCPAYVLRNVQYAVDAGERPFAPALRRLLCWAIAVGRRRAGLRDRAQAGADLQRQTRRWRGQLFTFLTDRAVPATNNARQYRAKADRQLDRLLAMPAATGPSARCAPA